MNNFYPQGYLPKETPSDYMKLEEGDNKIRILDKPIIGFEYWYEEDGKRKVARVKTFEEAVRNPVADTIKEFHAFIVWDYQEEAVKLLNITQRTIQRDIFTYANDPDWGTPENYDLVIKRSGKGLETQYNVIAKPAKALVKEAQEAFKQVKIDSEEYFDGGHPIVRGETASEVASEAEEALG